MTLQFPSSPSVGQTFPDPTIEGVPIWTWDGEKWAPGISLEPPLSTGGGVLTGPLVLAGDPVGPLDAATKQYVDDEVQEVAGAAMGVTDGSEAGPGEIGEYVDYVTERNAGDYAIAGLHAYNTGLYIQPSGSEPLLTPGDWDLECQVWVYLNGYNSGAAALPFFEPAIRGGLIVRGVSYGSYYPPSNAPFCGAAHYVHQVQSQGANNWNYIAAGPIILPWRLNFSVPPASSWFHLSLATGWPYYTPPWDTIAYSATPPMCYFRVKGRRIR